MNNGNFIAGMLLYATLTGIELSKQQSDKIAALNRTLFDARAVAKIARLKIKPSKAKLLNQLRNLPVLLRFASGECLLITERTGATVQVFDPITESQYPVELIILEQKFSGQCFRFTRKFGPSDIFRMFNLDFFLRPVRKYRMRFWEIIIASIFLQLIAAFTPLATQVVIDKIMPNRGFSSLAIIIILLLMLMIFQSLLSYVRQYIYSHTAAKADLILGASIYRKLLSLPFNYFEKRRTGDTVLRINSLSGVREFLTGPALTALIDTTFAIIFLIIIYSISPLLTLITLIFFPIQGIITLRSIPLLRRKLEKYWVAEADINAFAVETITGIRAIKSFSGEKLFARGWEKLIANVGASGYEMGISSVVLANTANFAQKLAGMAILWTGALLVINGDISVGQLVAVQMLAQSAGNPLANLFALWPQFQQAAIAAERIGDILAEPSEQPGKTATRLIDGTIEFEDISFSYAGKAPIFENFNLKIADGERLAIIGKSGSGKSTLAKLIQGIYRPSSGIIRIGGKDINDIPPELLRSHATAVLQDNYIFQGTAIENIALSGSRRLEEIVKVAEISGADEFLRQLPQKYASELGEQGANLSGGQRQRLAIARALLQNGKIIIFDEATSALDSISEKLFESKFNAICADKTAIIITHRLSSVKDCDRIIVLDGGKIAESGSHVQLWNQGGIYKSLLTATNSGQPTGVGHENI